MLSAFLNWFIGRLARTTCTVHSISARISQEGVKCTKAEEYLAKVLLSNVYTVLAMLLLAWHSRRLPSHALLYYTLEFAWFCQNLLVL